MFASTPNRPKKPSPPRRKLSASYCNGTVETQLGGKARTFKIYAGMTHKAEVKVHAGVCPHLSNQRKLIQAVFGLRRAIIPKQLVVLRKL